jgi:hypothetical protein
MSDQQENSGTGSVSSSESCEQAEHTPGPWELDEIDPSGLMKPIFVESGDATICAMAAFLEPNSHVDPKEAMANAQLIAAAPDLLQAAREAMRTLRVVGDYHGWSEPVEREYNSLKKAIAKA